MANHKNDIDSVTGDFPWAPLRGCATAFVNKRVADVMGDARQRGRFRAGWVDTWIQYVSARYTFRENGLDKWLAECDAYMSYVLDHCVEQAGVITEEGLECLVDHVLDKKDRRNGHWDYWRPLHQHLFIQRLSDAQVVQLERHIRSRFSDANWATADAAGFCVSELVYCLPPSMDILLHAMHAIRVYQTRQATNARVAALKRPRDEAGDESETPAAKKTSSQTK